MAAPALAEARPRGRPRTALAVQISGVALVAGVIFWIAYDGGAYAEQSRNSVAIGIWWLVLLGVLLGVWPLKLRTRAAAAVGTLLSGFAAWNLLSVLWSPSAADAVSEFNRAALYVGVFALAIVAGRRGNVGYWLDGLALALGAVATVALVSRLFPGSFPDRGLPEFLPSAQTRLSFPVDYWNGLGILLGLAVPLFLRYAAAPSRLLRVAAAGFTPALVAAIYLTSSRGAVATLLAAVIVYLVAVERRIFSVTAAILGGAGGAFVVWILGQRSELVNGPITSAAATTEGRSAAVLVLGACVVTGLLYVPLSVVLERVPPPPIRVARAGLVALVLLLVAGIVAVHPLRRLHQFEAPPQGLATGPGSDFVRAHLLSGSGSGRWQFWASALDEWRSAPLLGRGAGSYESWWAQHGSIPYFVEDAHSLYLETLGELGIVGFALLVLALLIAFAAGTMRARRSSGEERVVVAALLGVLAGYAVGAGVDWMWELTIVSVVAFICLGLLVGPGTAVRSLRLHDNRRPGRPLRSRLALGLPAAGAAWLILCVQAIPLLAGVAISQSQTASRAGDVNRALQEAATAQKIQPWAPTPYLQLALVYEQAGRFHPAHAAILKAIDHDPLDWRLWIVRVRLETKLGDIGSAIASLRRARELNPRSPLMSLSSGSG